ncbi:MAG: response regulator [Lachnospiraceae bacterium]|nr:response regulator [Lachnospiraceae bacterium]
MYRILLADDEKIVTDSVSMMINRHFSGQFEIQTAKNGRFMIEIFNSFHPDIVIADIQMPGINGITAIRELRKGNPDTIFIIMTAYDRFDYAKEALNLGVEEFLNKPFNDRIITELMNRCMKKIDSRRKQLSDSLRIQEKMESVIPVIENGFIYSMIFADDTNEEDVENYRNLLDVEEEYGCMLVITGGEEVKNRHMTNAIGSGVRLHQNYSMVKEYIRKMWPKAIVGSVISNRIPVFLPMKSQQLQYEERIELLEDARRLTRELRTMTERVFRIGIGSVVPMQEGTDSFKEARRALTSAEGSAVHIEDVTGQWQTDDVYPVELEKILYSNLKKNDQDSFLNSGAELLQQMIDCYGEEDPGVRMKILEILLYIERDAAAGTGLNYKFGDRTEYMPKIWQAERTSDLKIWFLERLGAAYKILHSAEKNQGNSVIEKAKCYIRENYTWDISLDDISRTLKLTPYYFSKLFKQETGSTFMEYLTGLRIEKAKQLLKDPELSIKEIGISVGYSDPNYFSRIFKKVQGETPTEYRGHV